MTKQPTLPDYGATVDPALLTFDIGAIISANASDDRRPGAALSDAEAQPLINAAMVLMTTTGPTALAQGAEKEVHSKRAMQQDRASQPRAPRAAKPAKKAPVKATKVARRNRPLGRLVLKANTAIRQLLTAAATAAGGSRLQPVGFASYTEFLAGVPLDKDGNATVSFIPVKGNEPIKGKNVKLVVKGGVPTVR